MRAKKPKIEKPKVEPVDEHAFGREFETHIETLADYSATEPENVLLRLGEIYSQPLIFPGHTPLELLAKFNHFLFMNDSRKRREFFELWLNHFWLFPDESEVN